MSSDEEGNNSEAEADQKKEEKDEEKKEDDDDDDDEKIDKKLAELKAEEVAELKRYKSCFTFFSTFFGSVACFLC